MGPVALSGAARVKEGVPAGVRRFAGGSVYLLTTGLRPGLSHYAPGTLSRAYQP